jgi:hypothetical protein
MIPSNLTHWSSPQQQYLLLALKRLQNHLANYGGLSELVVDSQPLEATLQTLKIDHGHALPLEQLTQVFNLSSFERDILLLCVGMELDQSFSQICATIHQDPQRAYPTFSLALAALPDPNWNAFTPAAPLRYHKLIKINLGFSLTQSPLQIDEHILHYLMGNLYLEPQLETLVEPLARPEELMPSHAQLVGQVVSVLSDSLTLSHPPLVQLHGLERNAQRHIAIAASHVLGLELYRIPASILPATLTEVEFLRQLWARESALSSRALMLDCDQSIAQDSNRLAMVAWLLERVPSLLFLTCRDRLYFPQRPLVNFEVAKPTYVEQKDLWHQVLEHQINQFQVQWEESWQTEQIQQLVANFSLDATKIRTICSEATARFVQNPVQNLGQTDWHHFAQHLWQACRAQTRPQIEELAQPIQTQSDWQNLVLPEEQTKVLREIVAHVRQQLQVYETWGFRGQGSRGLGITALFSGASGTGKTLAAEVLAQQLKLDLYRIELSAVVSKYIGDTEKNLQKIFDAAEDGSVILLFDEADALFGKRSEVKDSRDRYANVEVSYLLQRMERYPGLAILTTNLKSGIDTAFLRRIRFVVQFPFPDVAQRAEIWRRIFPAQTPLHQVDMAQLAQLNIAGGNIRNIALNAAFLAADAGEPSVQMKHLLQATQTEYAKLEKTLTETEIDGWV